VLIEVAYCRRAGLIGGASKAGRKTQKAQSGDWAFYLILGVADGARTHDNRNHNPGLYQLSYSHRCFVIQLALNNEPELYKPVSIPANLI
jgi:hypothetical protein